MKCNNGISELFANCHFLFISNDIFPFSLPNYQYFFSCFFFFFFFSETISESIYYVSNALFLSFHIIINLGDEIIASSGVIALNYLEGINL